MAVLVSLVLVGYDQVWQSGLFGVRAVRYVRSGLAGKDKRRMIMATIPNSIAITLLAIAIILHTIRGVH